MNKLAEEVGGVHSYKNLMYPKDRLLRSLDHYSLVVSEKLLHSTKLCIQSHKSRPAIIWQLRIDLACQSDHQEAIVTYVHARNSL